MKSSRKRKVTAAFFAAAALGGVAHAAPTLNMNDLVGSNTTTESTTQGTTNVVTPVVRPMATQPTPATAQPIVVAPQQAAVRPVQAQPMAPVRVAPPQMVPTQVQPIMQTQQVMQPSATTQAAPKVTPLIPRVRPVPVNDIAKALSDQQRAVSQPQYVVNKQTNAVMEPTLAMHSLMNVQRKTEPVTVQKQVDGKQQVQTTQVVRTPVMVQQESTTPLVIANTTQTKAVVAKQRLTIRDIQRAERERLAQLAAEEEAQQSGANQVDQQMVAQKQAEAQRQAAILAEQQRQMAMQAEQQRLAQQQAEAQRQAAMQAGQQRLAAQQAEAQRQAALRAEQERIAAEQAEQARIAEAQRQAAEQERLRIQEEQRRIAAQQQAEQQRLAAQQAEAQRQAAMQAEQQRLAAQQAEAQRQAALKAEQERIAAEQAEAQRQAAMQAEQQRLAAQQAEAQRQAALQAEQERIAAQQAEAQRQAALKAEQERIAAEQAEAQRQAALRAEQERIAAEQAEVQRQAALKAEQDRIAAEQAEAQRQAALKAEQERIASEQAEAQRQAALKAEQERIAAQQAEAQRQAALKAEQERIAAEEAARQRAEAAAKAEAERQAAIKAEQDRIAAEQAEAQRQAALKAEQERIAAEQAEAQRQAALKAEQDRIAAQQAEMARQAAIKEEQERLAAEQLAKEEAEAAAKAQAEAEAKAKAEAEAKAKAEAEAKAKAKAEAEAQAEAEAKAKAESEATAKAQAEAEAKAKAEAEATKAQESKLPQSYVDARNEASTKGSAVTEEKNILSQPMEPPLQADSSAKISLAFDAKNYESMSTTVDNKEIKYRAFEYIPYVANPIDIDQQYMNIYVPEEYFNNGTVNGYNTQTAPIFMPNAVGGYMPSQAMTPKVENGKPNSVLYALSRGYVVASPATRGRTNKASDGNFIGKAPAVIVDLQAATAYLHANDSTMPGNANRIITNGTSAGGAVSLLQGAAGNNSDFQPYLQALGAATAATNVYAVSAYAPITNLDAADMAYEWSYKGITSFNKVTMGQGELPQANVGGNTASPQRTMQRVNLNADDVAYSNLLSEHFPEYVNNLQLRDAMGRMLKLDKNGNGTFKNYVKAFIIDAANKAQAKGTDLSKHTYLVRDGKTGAIKDINWEAYNQFVSRSKAPGAFDSRSNDSGENSLFGTSTTDNNHFTITAALHDTTPNQDVYVENAKIVTMMNPMNYLGSPAATNARYYRIRYGTADSNTSVAIPLIVGARAQNLGYNVDMATPFGVDHSGDYDLDELFNWMDNIVKNGR